MIWNSKPICPPPVMRSRIKITVVSAVTISRTNITGFLISVRGSSLTKAEPIAGTTIFGSKSADTGTRLRSVDASIANAPISICSREKCTGVDQQLLDDRPKRERREEREATDDHDDTDYEANEQSAGSREGPR